MNRTVREITKELGTNKNVVYRIINKMNLEPVTNENPKEPKRYSEESFQIIKERYSALQEWHGETQTESGSISSDNSDIVLALKNQIERYEKEIERLNKAIEDKDATIKELVKTSHLETMRYQELIAREQNTRLLLTAKSSFNLFKPSTWKRAKTPDLEPLTESENT